MHGQTEIQYSIKSREWIQHGWMGTGTCEAIWLYERWKDKLSIVDSCVIWGEGVVVPPPGRDAVMNETHPGIVKMKETCEELHLVAEYFKGFGGKGTELCQMPGIQASSSS